MKPSDLEEFNAFYKEHAARLVQGLVAELGTRRSDAEDAAQVAFHEVSVRWSSITQRAAYLKIAAQHELWRLSRRTQGDVDHTLLAPEWIGPDTSEDTYRLDAGIVGKYLALATPRQRQVMAMFADGRTTREIAEALSVEAGTVRKHLENGRKALQKARASEDDLDLRAVYAAHEVVRRGGGVPTDGLPPLIRQSWLRVADHSVDLEHGALVAPLGLDEVRERRRASPLMGCPWALEAMHDVCRDRGMTMLVVLDGDGRVLYRRGERRVVGMADRVGFVDGALWTENTAATNAAGVALATGLPAHVAGPHHLLESQFLLTCYAAPIRTNDGQTIGVLNLTERTQRAHPVLHAKVKAIASLVEQQLRRQRARWHNRRPGSSASAGPEPDDHGREHDQSAEGEEPEAEHRSR